MCCPSRERARENPAPRAEMLKREGERASTWAGGSGIRGLRGECDARNPSKATRGFCAMRPQLNSAVGFISPDLCVCFSLFADHYVSRGLSILHLPFLALLLLLLRLLLLLLPFQQYKYIYTHTYKYRELCALAFFTSWVFFPIIFLAALFIYIFLVYWLHGYFYFVLSYLYLGYTEGVLTVLCTLCWSSFFKTFPC